MILEGNLSTMPKNQHLVPIVVEQTGRGERSYDIYSRLLRDRIVFIGGAIDDGMANSACGELMTVIAPAFPCLIIC